MGGIHNTMRALERGWIGTIIVWNQLKITRVTVVNWQTKKESHLYLTDRELDAGALETDCSKFIVTERIDFLEWLTENYKKYGIVMEVVTDRSHEGREFIKYFGGICSSRAR